MDYVEIIRLRVAAGSSREDAHRAVESSIDAGAPGLVASSVYGDVRVNSDLAVHLHYRLGGELGPRDGLGLRIAAVLEEYGLVDRALWIRVAGSNENGEVSR